MEVAALTYALRWKVATSCNETTSSIESASTSEAPDTRSGSSTLPNNHSNTTNHDDTGKASNSGLPGIIQRKALPKWSILPKAALLRLEEPLHHEQIPVRRAQSKVFNWTWNEFCTSWNWRSAKHPSCWKFKRQGTGSNQERHGHPQRQRGRYYHHANFDAARAEDRAPERRINVQEACERPNAHSSSHH